MKIHLPTYGQGVHEINQDLEAAELELDPAIFEQAVHAALRLDRHDPYFEFRIHLTAIAHAECDRCLEGFQLPLEVRAPLLFVAGHPPKGDDVDDTDIVYFKAGTTELDLSHDFRDLLILAYSGKHLCDENCKGLCPNCGANLNEHFCECAPN
ncbi:MAG: DUF177 domain-containing protein [Calditrichaeota bacterium]|nr:DUF177 domain-containing protein [Calditrichota bacterium]MCB9366483.1 DUF177 domain-containing protein [Calditrichota bacterium]MCB9391259.1 DUF177 domain-containing protein [Calditrichota bacterium]